MNKQLFKLNKTKLYSLSLLVFMLITNLNLNANTIFRTNQDDSKITIKMELSTIKDVLNTLQEKTSYDLFYSDDLKDLDKIISVDYKEQSIESILTNLLNDTKLEYTVENKDIVISYNVDKKAPQQKKTTLIQGKVIDESGVALPGVNIIHREDKVGTYSDIDGNYKIEVTNMDGILSFSFVGLETIEEPINGREMINISMEKSSNRLDDVILTGYQQIEVERATGSFAKIKAKDIEEFYSPDVTTLLEGKVAGLSTFGDKIVIRGVSTINGDSSPLVVVDGLPLETQTLDDINPNDIESVTVLKDAAAASIYGARAANGVIVVTTKKAKANVTQVDFSANYTITKKDNQDYRKVLGNSNYVDYESNFLNNTPSYIADPVAYFDQKNGDNNWYSPVYGLYEQLARGTITQSELDQALGNLKSSGNYRDQYNDNVLQDQFRQQYNLSLRTGTEKSSILLSLNANTNKASTIGTTDDRYTIYFKNDIKFYDWLNVSYGINTVISKNKDASADSYGAQPYEQILDKDGNRVYRDLINQAWADTLRTPKNQGLGLYDMAYNVLDEYELNSRESESYNTRLFVNTNFKLIDGLDFDMMFQYNVVSASSKEYKDEYSYNMRNSLNRYAEFVPGVPGGWAPIPDSYNFNLPKGGNLYQTAGNQKGYTFRNQLNFNRTFNTDHYFSALAGFEMSENNLNSQSSKVYGYSDQTLVNNMNMDWSNRWLTGAMSPTAIPFGVKPFTRRSEVVNRYISYYANAGYTYKNKYSVTGSYRVDQTNLFGTDPKYRFRPLWSVGASWLISEEDFMDADWMNYLKLRTSYGIGGNVDKTTSPYLTASPATSGFGAPTYVIFSPPNPLLRWEKTATFNAGVDFAMLNNRLSGSLDIYSKNSTDLLANKNLDASLGFTEAKVNNGAMTNKGIELAIGYDWVKNQDWYVSTYFTAAYNKNEVTQVEYDPSVANDLLRSSGYYLQGAALSSIYGYNYEGLDKNGDPLVHDIITGGDGVEKDTITSGQYVKNYEALINMGQTDPKWTGSFQPVVGYKGLKLSALFTFYTGNVKRDNVTPLYRSIKGEYIHGDVANAWTTTNTDTTIPRMASQDLTDGYRNDNWLYANTNIIDASSVYLRNIVLSYTLRKEWSNSVKASNIRFNFQVNNPWSWQASLQSDYTKQMTLPSYVFGVNVNF